MSHYRPVVQQGRLRPEGAMPLCGGPGWFTHAVAHARDAGPRIVTAAEMPSEWRDRLAAPRPAIATLGMDRPRIMGILNTTPDSFSDGGRFDAPDRALAHATQLTAAGADILDIGGESTRPGAATVSDEDEIARTAPVIARIRESWDGPISIDTRKARVAEAAAQSGASILNDVSALTYDPKMATVAVSNDLPVCLMHAQGEPQTMQDDPRYDDVLLDVYDALAAHIDAAEAAGIPRDRIIADPGIGFGKTLAHNLTLLEGLAMFHGLGVPLLVGVSRKRFIGALGNAPEARDRTAGSVAVALHAAHQGAQILRVHDVAETRQALTLWTASITGDRP